MIIIRKIILFWGFAETLLRQKQVFLIPNWGYEVLQILSISLMDKTPLVDLFKRTDFNNVKELDCPLFPGLFDQYLTGPDFNGILMMENNEIAVRDILNKEERAQIHSMGVDSQDSVYLLELQNSDKKLIQYLPIRFTYIK